MRNTVVENRAVSAARLHFVVRFFHARGVDKNESAFCHSQAAGIMFGPSYDYAKQLTLSATTGRRSMRILELGCGCGWDAIALSGDDHRVCAIDVDELRIAAARENVDAAGKEAQVSVYRMDAESLAFGDDRFDLIFANSFLLWVDRKAALNECRRVVEPGGKLLFLHESLQGNPFINLYRKAGFRRLRESLVQRPSPRELEYFAEMFSAFEARYFYLISPLLYPLLRRFHTAAWLRHSCRLFHQLDEWLLRRFPYLRRFAWIAVLQFTK